MLFSAIPFQKKIIKLLSHPQDDRFQFNLSHYFHKDRLKLNQAVTKFASFPKLNVSDIYCGPSVVHFNFDLSFSILFLIFRFSSLSNFIYLSLSLSLTHSLRVMWSPFLSPVDVCQVTGCPFKYDWEHAL